MRLFTLGLSLDPNPHSTGFVLWHNEEPFRWGIFAPLEKPETSPKWLRMSLSIWRELVKLKPDWVACEGTYGGPNPKVAGELHRIVGNVACYSMWRLVPYFELSTSQIDSLTGVPHTGRKKHNLELAKVYLKEKVKQDTADALCVGVAGWSKYKEWKINEHELNGEGLPLP